MVGEVVEITFHGTRCCVFGSRLAHSRDLGARFETIRDYGSACLEPDGRVRHWFYKWDEGDRLLQRCRDCGAWFLVQRDEYHGPEDDYYTDWFQVDDQATADLINESWDGSALPRNYRGPHLWDSQRRLVFDRGESSADLGEDGC